VSAENDRELRKKKRRRGVLFDGSRHWVKFYGSKRTANLQNRVKASSLVENQRVLGLLRR